jgi:gamma-glutamyl-gamma-aminobutyrate hydrolase PuuD
MKVYITASVKKYYKTYIDFLDHYWINFFRKFKIDYELLSSDKNKTKKQFKVINKKNTILIITGGSDVIGDTYDTLKRNEVEKFLIQKCLKYKIPIFGICRGAQLFAKIKGLQITKKKNHMNTMHEIFLKKKFLNFGKKIIVNSYHNYCIKISKIKLFDFLATDKNNYVELFLYNKKNLFIMWHPERNINYLQLKTLFNFFYKK